MSLKASPGLHTRMKLNRALFGVQCPFFGTEVEHASLLSTPEDWGGGISASGLLNDVVPHRVCSPQSSFPFPPCARCGVGPARGPAHT